MATKLDEIFENKKKELVETKKSLPLEALKQMVEDSSREILDVFSALKGQEGGRTNIIAEIKKKTPFKGELRAETDPVEFAKVYEENGAVAISVLTESNYFDGSLGFLKDIRKQVNIPLLRKDFIFETYQIYEALAFGADFFLLISTYLDESLLKELIQFGKELGILAVVEVHDEEDLKKTMAVNADIIGINNRNLKNGTTDLNITRRLLEEKFNSNQIIISESGINARNQILELSELGVNCFLVGESLMRAKDTATKLRELLGSNG